MPKIPGFSSLTSPIRPAVVELVGGTAGASLSSETDELRRRRLRGAAIFLACAFGAFALWSISGHSTNYTLLTKGSLFVRSAIALAVALFLSRPGLPRRWVLVAEYILFLGCIALMVGNQYILNMNDLRRNDVAGAVASIKNGAFGTVILMLIYGMLIPNNAAATARVVIPVALVQGGLLAFVLRRPDVAEAVKAMRMSEHAGSNVLFLLIGAGLSIYGASLLNGLRTQLHEARKFGQYRLGRKLGSGGMGEVYLAEHALLKRPCALKLIRQEASANPTALARFELEVQSSARLAHPNTIEIYDYGHTDDGTFYYVMEYLRGMSLGDMVRVYGPLPPGRLIYLMRQVCAGLNEAHALGLVHRDLKPANLFIASVGGETDVAKVLDFGLVKPTRGPDRSFSVDQTVSGTPHFMAPEQAAGDPSIDPRADIYALGSVMYYALTGHPPFQGETAMAVMLAHSRDPIVPPSKLRPDLPRDLEAVVLRCLAKPPADRYPTVRDLSNALAHCACAPTWGPDLADAWWKSSNLLDANP